MNKNEQKFKFLYTLIWYYICLTIFVHFCSFLFTPFLFTFKIRWDIEQKWTKKHGNPPYYVSLEGGGKGFRIAYASVILLY